MARLKAKAEDLSFMGDVEAAAKRGGGWWASLLLFSILTFVGVFLVWAAWAELDRVTRGQGRVVPTSQMQVVQNLEGGIVSQIFVREGETVAAGQPLMQIDDTSFSAVVRESEVSRAAMKAMLARLDAEITDSEPEFPEDIRQIYADLVGAELQLMLARRQEVQGQVDVLAQQEIQRRQEEAELRSRIETLNRSRQLLVEEIQIVEPNVISGASPRVRLVRLEQRLAELDGELDGARLALPRIQAALDETRTQIASIRSSFVVDAQEERNQIATRLARLEETLAADEDRVARTEVQAPVAGVVNRVLVTTVGGVVQPGMPLMEIVPTDDSLVVEAQIQPKDVAFLRPGQPVKVKLTAYDFARFGALDGEVMTISADTVMSDAGESVYEITVRTDQAYLGTAEDPLPIIPGMVAEVDILVGKRTVLEYILVPLERAQQRALRES